MTAKPSTVATILAMASMGVAPPARAQASGMPAGWRAVLDAPARYEPDQLDPNAGEAYRFVDMAPGWHITTGPGTLLFNPGIRAAGRYRLETEFFFFPDPSDQPLGLFMGGAGLEGPAANLQWYGLLVRRDGTAGVVHHQDTADYPLVRYARADSLPPHPGKGTPKVILAIEVEADSVRFFVNHGRVAAVARAGLELDGPFGFRVGRGLNLHVVRLDYTRKLAPARGGA